MHLKGFTISMVTETYELLKAVKAHETQLHDNYIYVGKLYSAEYGITEYG